MPAVLITGSSRGLTRTGYDRANMLSPAESVGGLRAVIAGLKPEDTGGFFHYTGERVPW
jgi:hypothetical protein